MQRWAVMVVIVIVCVVVVMPMTMAMTVTCYVICWNATHVGLLSRFKLSPTYSIGDQRIFTNGRNNMRPHHSNPLSRCLDIRRRHHGILTLSCIGPRSTCVGDHGGDFNIV
jgi:hypothetical protein